MIHSLKTGVAAILFAATLPLAGCNQVQDENPKTATKEDGTVTLASALSSDGKLGTLQKAISAAELGSVFDGPGSYTLLAPNDAAFEALGEQGAALMQEDQRPLLVGLLRNHILPGHLTPEAIDKAIAQKGGDVTMTTLGDGKVTFSKVGDKIMVSSDGGAKSEVSGTSIAANNGVVIPMTAVLMPATDAAKN